MAVVVEFDTIVEANTVAAQANRRLANIVAIIGSEEHAAADIIVFSEYALGDVEPQMVPDPSKKVVLCNNQTNVGPLVAVSCAAKLASTYVVLNVLTQHNCSHVTLNESSPSSSPVSSFQDKAIYNSNIVFDRTGAVISM